MLLVRLTAPVSSPAMRLFCPPPRAVSVPLAQAMAVRLSGAIPKAAKRPARDVYWTDLKKVVKTPIFDGALLAAGNRIAGPCVVETAQTNVVVHPGRTLRVDAYGNFEISFQA